MKSTNKFDCNGKEVFVGDKILHAWAWFQWEGEMKTAFQIHTIKERKAHMMANGEMHDDGGGVIYCMGNCSNFWKGKDVEKITLKTKKRIGIEEDTMFFFNKDGNPVRYTDQHLLGMNDEEFEKHLFDRQKKIDDILFFGDIT